MKKTALRKIYRQKRKELSNLEIENSSLQIAENILNSPFKDYKNYLVFYPIRENKEVETLALIHKLWELDKNVFLPKIFQENIESIEYKEGDKLNSNSLKIKEPESNIIFPKKDLDIVVLPMFICDQKGYRVGYGGGFYDRFLENADNLIKVGVNFFNPLKEDVERNPYDVKLDYCVTPSEIVSFSDKL